MGIFTVTIRAGEDISDAIDISTAQVLALIMPKEWTGAAPISFQLSVDNVMFYDLGSLYSSEVLMIPWGSDQWIPLAANDFPKNTYLKIRSGHPADPMPQDEERVFMLVNDAVIVAEEPPAEPATKPAPGES